MSTSRSPASFPGPDLTPLWRELVDAWHGMWVWLTPKLPVQLWLPSGQAVSCQGPDTPQRPDGKKLRPRRFVAVLLPEELLLRSQTDLPRLKGADVVAALQLEVSGLCPFPADDLVWTHESAPLTKADSASVQVHLALASRKLIAKHLQQTHPDLNPSTTEIWLPSALGSKCMVLPGFGEAARLRRQAQWRWVSIFLFLLALILLATIALTPTAHLYLRARQAHAAMDALQQKAAPVLQLREVLTHSSDQLTNLATVIGQPVHPLQGLHLMTDALPDDTSLLSLQQQGLKVSMTGQTADTTVLMKQLSATPGLRDVTAPAPAVKPPGATRESFTIEFKLDANGPKQIQAQPVVPAPAK